MTRITGIIAAAALATTLLPLRGVHAEPWFEQTSIVEPRLDGGAPGGTDDGLRRSGIAPVEGAGAEWATDLDALCGEGPAEWVARRQWPGAGAWALEGAAPTLEARDRVLMIRNDAHDAGLLDLGPLEGGVLGAPSRRGAGGGALMAMLPASAGLVVLGGAGLVVVRLRR